MRIPKFKPFAEYRGVQILKPNRLEFERAVGAWPGESQLPAVGCELAEKSGVEAIALTRGDEGAHGLRSRRRAVFPCAGGQRRRLRLDGRRRHRGGGPGRVQRTRTVA